MRLSLKCNFGCSLFLKKSLTYLHLIYIHTQGSFCGVGSNLTHTLGWSQGYTQWWLLIYTSAALKFQTFCQNFWENNKLEYTANLTGSGSIFYRLNLYVAEGTGNRNLNRFHLLLKQ